MDAEMFIALRDAALRLRSEPEVRVVVLSGEGPSFCSGLDLASLATAPEWTESALERPAGEIANMVQLASYGWQQVPVPVIAAIHGNCLGGGFQIALGADIRIASPQARLSVREVEWGLIPDMGISATLPRLTGLDIAKELTFTGRIFDGLEARELGLVTRLAEDPYAAAHELAAQIGGRSPDAVRSAKRLYNEAWGATPADALRLEAELQRRLFGSPNQLEAVRAGMAKQPPQFGPAQDSA